MGAAGSDCAGIEVVKVRRLGWHGLLFILVLAFCVYVLFRQETLFPQWFEHSDKWAHAAAFFALVLLGYGAMSRIGFPFLWLLMGVLALAVGSEWVQGTEWLPLRNSDWGDLMANLSGWGLGVIAVVGWEWQRLRVSLQSTGSR